MVPGNLAHTFSVHGLKHAKTWSCGLNLIISLIYSEGQCLIKCNRESTYYIIIN